MYETARPFLLAIAIGLLIGLERERARTEQRVHEPLGSRTFTLLALLGAVAAHVESPAIAIVLSVFSGAIIIAGYFRSRVSEEGAGVGMTTEVAAMAAFTLGYLSHSEPALAIMLAVITLVVLALKPRIHHFAQVGLRQEEISAALTFLVIAFVVLPLLPNRYVDPWNLINPSRLWLLFVLIAGISFGGYIAVRLLGAARGLEATGFFAGFVSSTAATLSLARRGAGRGAPIALLSVAIVLANAASACSQLLIIAANYPGMIAPAARVIGAPIILGVLGAAVVMRIYGRQEGEGIPLGNPLELRPTAILAVVIGGVLVVASVAVQYFGTAGVVAMSVLVGATNVQAVTLAASTLSAGGNLPVRGAVLACLIAFECNMVVKISLIGWAGGRRLLAVTAPPLLGMMAAGAVAYFLTPA